MSVMGMVGHRLQQGRVTNLYLVHQQNQHHGPAPPPAPGGSAVTTVDSGSDGDDDSGPKTFSNTTSQSTAPVAQQAEMTGSSRVPRVPKAEMTESSRVPRILKAEMTESSRVPRVPEAEMTESSRVPINRVPKAEITETNDNGNAMFQSYLSKLQKRNRLKIRSYHRYGEHGEKMFVFLGLFVRAAVRGGTCAFTLIIGQHADQKQLTRR